MPQAPAGGMLEACQVAASQWLGLPAFPSASVVGGQVVGALITWSLGIGYYPVEAKGIASLASYGLGLGSACRRRSRPRRGEASHHRRGFRPPTGTGIGSQTAPFRTLS
jgi:hypothetical protein